MHAWGSLSGCTKRLEAPAGGGEGEDEEQRPGGGRGLFAQLSAAEPCPTPGS